jgi:hypothetical protein
MKKKRFHALIGCVAFLAGCMQSNSPIENKTGPDGAPVAVTGPVLRDPDNRPITEVPVDLLQDIRRQMVEKGLTEDLKELEAAYDFQTGKLRETSRSTAR